jgi:hypothetical protein
MTMTFDRHQTIIPMLPRDDPNWHHDMLIEASRFIGDVPSLDDASEFRIDTDQEDMVVTINHPDPAYEQMVSRFIVSLLGGISPHNRMDWDYDILNHRNHYRITTYGAAYAHRHYAQPNHVPVPAGR